MAETIISREQARAQGLKRFFTGEPCRNGHVSERLVSNGFCRECYRATRMRFEARHPEKIAAHRARMKVLQEESGYFRSYYRKNAETRKSQASDWYVANKQRALSACKEWAKRNPDKRRENGRLSSRIRRAKVGAVDGTHTRHDLARIYHHQRGKCAYCKADLRQTTAEVDHIIPLARGGGNGPDNLQYLCRPCNRAKSAKDPIEFAQERGLLL